MWLTHMLKEFIYKNEQCQKSIRMFEKVLYLSERVFSPCNILKYNFLLFKTPPLRQRDISEQLVSQEPPEVRWSIIFNLAFYLGPNL